MIPRLCFLIAFACFLAALYIDLGGKATLIAAGIMASLWGMAEAA